MRICGEARKGLGRDAAALLGHFRCRGVNVKSTFEQKDEAVTDLEAFRGDTLVIELACELNRLLARAVRCCGVRFGCDGSDAVASLSTGSRDAHDALRR